MSICARRIHLPASSIGLRVSRIGLRVSRIGLRVSRIRLRVSRIHLPARRIRLSSGTCRSVSTARQPDVLMFMHQRSDDARPNTRRPRGTLDATTLDEAERQDEATNLFASVARSMWRCTMDDRTKENPMTELFTSLNRSRMSSAAGLRHADAHANDA